MANNYLPGSGPLSVSTINGVFSRGTSMSNYAGTQYYRADSPSVPRNFNTTDLSFSDFYNTSPNMTFVISTNQQNFNLWNALGSPTVPVNVFCVINSGVQITATNNATPAFRVGSFNGSSNINIINNGYIVGKGGTGISQKVGGPYLGAPASAYGGPAFEATIRTVLTNYGVIGGGGGAGGAGGAGSADCSCSHCGGLGVAGGGGSGGGAGYGSGVTALCNYWANCSTITRAVSEYCGAYVNTGNGTLTSPGAGANSCGQVRAGQSGGLGAAGANGWGSACGCPSTVGTYGAPGGAATTGSGNIIWAYYGAVYGVSV